MFAASLGPLRFTDWKGDPLRAQTHWVAIEQEGVDGVLWEDAGYDAEEFSAEVWADCPSDAFARDLANVWQAHVSAAPMQLIIANFDYGYYRLVRVHQPRIEPILWGRGGLCEHLPGAPVAQAILIAQLRLRQITVGTI
jgi:hypothetical protein